MSADSVPSSKNNIFQSKLIYYRHFRTYSRCAMFDWSDTVFRRINVTRRRTSNTVLQPRYWGREADSPEICRLISTLLDSNSIWWFQCVLHRLSYEREKKERNFMILGDYILRSHKHVKRNYGLRRRLDVITFITLGELGNWEVYKSTVSVNMGRLKCHKALNKNDWKLI